MAVDKSKLLRRANGVLALLVGIFGALAILGVFFKIAKYPNYEIYMAIGFFGEAAAFIVMGLLAFVTSFVSSEGAAEGDKLAFGADAGAAFDASLEETASEFRSTLQAASEGYRASMESAAGAFRESMHEMLRENLGANLEGVVQSVKGDVERFGNEMRGLGGEMERAREAVQGMSSKMEAVATGTLAEDAERLGTGMHQLSEGMSEAGASVDRMRNDLNEMATRFRAFNGPASSPPRLSENGVDTTVVRRSETSGGA